MLHLVGQLLIYFDHYVIELHSCIQVDLLVFLISLSLRALHFLYPEPAQVHLVKINSKMLYITQDVFLRCVGVIVDGLLVPLAALCFVILFRRTARQ